MFRRPLLFLLLLSLPLYFITANHWSFDDVDESHYVEVAKELVKGGDWLTLHYNGIPWFHKPPLVFWLVGASFKTFGINEFSARLPIIILAIMSIFLTYFIAQELFHNSYASLLSAIILLTSSHFLRIGHAVLLDVPTIFFILLGLYGLFRSSVKKEWAILYGLGLGLAILSKGVLGTVLLICVVPYIIWQKKFFYLRNPYLWIGIIGGIALCGSWYFYQIRIHGNDFLKVHFWEHVIQRSTKEICYSGGLGIFFYPFQILFNFFPWSIILIFSLFENIKNFLKKSDGDSLVVIWTAVFLFIITMMRTKLHHYCLPLYPFFAMSAGQWTSHILKEGGFVKRLKAINWIYLGFSFLMLFLIFFVKLVPDYAIYRNYIPLAFTISIFFFALGLFYLCAVRNSLNQLWIKLLIAGTYAILIIAVLTLKMWDFNPEIKQLAKINIRGNVYSLAPPERPNIDYPARVYFGESFISHINPGNLKNILDKGAIVLTKEKMILKEGIRSYKIIAQSGDWLLIQTK